MIRLNEIVYTERRLERCANREEKLFIEITINMGQIIILQNNVIYNWKLEEVIEDMYTMKFRFHKIVDINKKSKRFAYYQIQRNASGHPVLIRIPNDLKNEGKN